MTWLTWRQFRGQAVTALVALAALAISLVVLGMQIRNTYQANVECEFGCSLSAAREALLNSYRGPLLLAGLAVVAVPALIGAFWGAPLVARELETGTHRLVWSQSVTRTRWLAVKLVIVAVAGVALAGALSALFTWAASPYDELVGGRFEPLFFPTRNIAPLGYAVFAVVLGITMGLLARRTVLAMAITLAVFVVLQILVPTVVRPHLQPPVTETVAFTTDTWQTAGSLSLGDGARVGIRTMAGAWVLTDEAPLLDATGDSVTRDQLADAGCLAGDPDTVVACLAEQDLYFTVSFQPADRYWTFQWLELAAYLAAAGLLAGFAFWRIRRGLH